MYTTEGNMQRIGFILLLGFVLLLPFNGYCSPDGATTRLSSFDQNAISEVKTLRAIPKQGWIKGNIGPKAISLTFDRVAWTISGTIGALPVDIKIDHAAKTIRGFAQESGVDLTFTWSPEEIALEGQVYGLPYILTTNWQAGTSTGGFSCSLMEFAFSLEKGTFEGFLADRKATLKFDHVSGRITGDFFRKPINLQLVNLDFSDFIHHLYLFLK